MEHWRILIQTTGKNGLRYYSEEFEGSAEECLYAFWFSGAGLPAAQIVRILKTIDSTALKSRKFRMRGCTGYTFQMVGR